MVKKYNVKEDDKFYECSCGLVFKKDGRVADCPRCRLIESKLFEQDNIVDLYDIFKNSSKFVEILRKINE